MRLTVTKWQNENKSTESTSGLAVSPLRGLFLATKEDLYYCLTINGIKSEFCNTYMFSLFLVQTHNYAWEVNVNFGAAKIKTCNV